MLKRFPSLLHASRHHLISFAGNLVFGVVFLMAGCAQWEKPDGSADQRSTDLAHCNAQASQEFPLDSYRKTVVGAQPIASREICGTNIPPNGSQPTNCEVKPPVPWAELKVSQDRNKEARDKEVAACMTGLGWSLSRN